MGAGEHWVWSLIMDKKTAAKIFKLLDKAYPKATTALAHETPWQLLMATILSAQCTYKRVNLVTPVLFNKFKSLNSFFE
jgi:endonuclease-3